MIIYLPTRRRRPMLRFLIKLWRGWAAELLAIGTLVFVLLVGLLEALVQP